MATDERGAALVRHLLAGGRLVTLTGPAGNGKSHLARVVVARWARRHPGAVHLIELETLVDGIGLLEEAAAVFAMPPPVGHSVLRALAEHIGAARTLLVLDGCDGIADSCARLAAALLSRCPRLALLATSRTALGLPGEVTWRRPGLSAWHPADDGLAEPEPDEGARLLLRWSERWRSPHRPGSADPAAAARICWRLCGLPRALELVSAPLALLGASAVEAALSRADGPLVPEDALRAALALSYQALPGQLRGLLRRLTVFPAEFTADSAAGVCGVGPGLPGLESALDELTRRGLIRRRRGRSGLTLYRLPGGERTALTRWAPEGRVWTELTGRRRRFYLDLAERSPPSGEARTAWRARLEEERNELRALLADPGGEPRELLRLAVALDWLWEGGFREEGQRRLGDVLSKVREGTLRATALHRLGRLEALAGRLAAAREYLAASLALQDRRNAGETVLALLDDLAAVALAQGDPEAAGNHAHRAVELAGGRSPRLDLAPAEIERRRLAPVEPELEDAAARVRLQPTTDAGRTDVVEPWPRLPQRQLDVLDLAARGLTDKEIAARLGISFRTVRTHLERLYQRQGVRGRTQLVARWAAWRAGGGRP